MGQIRPFYCQNGGTGCLKSREGTPGSGKIYNFTRFDRFHFLFPVNLPSCLVGWSLHSGICGIQGGFKSFKLASLQMMGVGEILKYQSFLGEVRHGQLKLKDRLTRLGDGGVIGLRAQ